MKELYLNDDMKDILIDALYEYLYNSAEPILDDVEEAEIDKFFDDFKRATDIVLLFKDE